MIDREEASPKASVEEDSTAWRMNHGVVVVATEVEVVVRLEAHHEVVEVGAEVSRRRLRNALLGPKCGRVFAVEKLWLTDILKAVLVVIGVALVIGADEGEVEVVVEVPHAVEGALHGEEEAAESLVSEGERKWS